MKQKEKPGVMVYFDLLPVISQLSNADKGRLFQAILEYAQPGVVPELPSKLRPVWPMLTSRIDNDDVRYKQTIAKRRYAAYSRWEREEDRIPLGFTDWMRKEGFYADA